jgi:hypothetical protein
MLLQVFVAVEGLYLLLERTGPPQWRQGQDTVKQSFVQANITLADQLTELCESTWYNWAPGAVDYLIDRSVFVHFLNYLLQRSHCSFTHANA